MFLADNIKKLRKQKGLSQIELAAQIDVYPDYISWWESGKRTPSLVYVIALADFFEITIDQLCRGDLK